MNNRDNAFISAETLSIVAKCKKFTSPEIR